MAPTRTTHPSPPASAVKVSERQLRKFILDEQAKTRATQLRIIVKEANEAVMADYRKRLKLGYEPLNKARAAVAGVPELAHHAQKLQAILNDIMALFKETSAQPAGAPEDRPTLPSTRFPDPSAPMPNALPRG